MGGIHIAGSKGCITINYTGTVKRTGVGKKKN